MPITPKIFFRRDVSLHHAEQNGAKIFVLGQNRKFSMNFQSGEKSRFENP